MALVAKPEAATTAAKQTIPAFIPKFLFHTILTVVDYPGYLGGGKRTVYPLGTHADLDAAKVFATKTLQMLGYDRADFLTYEERNSTANEDANGDAVSWPYGDGSVVCARRPGGDDFLISIITTPNNEQLPAKQGNSADLQYPHGSDLLHYVFQTKVDYNKDRSGAVQSTDIEGVYIHRADALAAAKACLVSDEIKSEDFAEYDEQDSESFKDEWPFGEDVVVHAVSQMGENFTVAVLTALRAHTVHGKKAAQVKE